MALPLAGFLLSMAWPVVRKVLAALGIGFVTYGGLTLIATQVQSQVAEYWGLLGSNVIQILSMGGIPQALGILLGSLAARVAFITAAKLAKLV